MNLSPSFTNVRSFTSYQFSRLRMRAVWSAFLAKISGRDWSPETFPTEREYPNRKLIGLKTVHVSQIIGTLNRTSDFDRQFRPLGKHLLNRWVNTYINRDLDGWAPILVHKIGEDYYVEDGHHRVSVARATEMIYIEANVWEHSAHPPKLNSAPEKEYAGRCGIEAYVAQ